MSWKVGLAGVLYVGNVAAVAVHFVVHSLNAAVRQVNVVSSMGRLSVPILLVTKVPSVVGVVYLVAVGVVGGSVVVAAAVTSVAVAVVGCGEGGH